MISSQELRKEYEKFQRGERDANAGKLFNEKMSKSKRQRKNESTKSKIEPAGIASLHWKSVIPVEPAEFLHPKIERQYPQQHKSPHVPLLPKLENKPKKICHTKMTTLKGRSRKDGSVEVEKGKHVSGVDDDMGFFDEQDTEVNDLEYLHQTTERLPPFTRRHRKIRNSVALATSVAGRKDVSIRRKVLSGQRTKVWNERRRRDRQETMTVLLHTTAVSSNNSGCGCGQCTRRRACP